MPAICPQKRLDDNPGLVQPGWMTNTVRLITEARAGRPTIYCLTWYPEAGERRRQRFSDEKEALREKRKIEQALAKRRSPLTPVEEDEYRSATLYRDEFAPASSILDLIKLAVRHVATESKAININVVQAAKEFIESRSDKESFSIRHRQTVRQHMNRFILKFGHEPLRSVSHDGIKDYLSKEVGGEPKTRLQHLITIRSFFRWAQIKKEWLPYGSPTPADKVDRPVVRRKDHIVYTPEEIIRQLIFTPSRLLMYVLLGQFAGVRGDERLRMFWSHWHSDEENKLVLDETITKNQTRRIVDVQPNLAEWMSALRGNPNEPMVPVADPYDDYRNIFKAACVKSRHNAHRAGFASYHLALFQNASLTALQDGHTPSQLLTGYRSIKGVTQKSAQAVFDITPSCVLKYARDNCLPMPEWTDKFALTVAV